MHPPGDLSDWPKLGKQYIKSVLYRIIIIEKGYATYLFHHWWIEPYAMGAATPHSS